MNSTNRSASNGLLLILFFAIILSSCTSTRMKKELSLHNAQLSQLAGASMQPLDKLDALAAYSIEALENSLEYNKTKDMVKFIKLYSQQNKKSVDKIYNDISKWYLALSDGEKLIVAARIATKPYVRQLLKVVPKVESKIDRKLDKIFYISRFMKLLNLGL